ncbi:MAG: Clp1/GlmU family protein [Caldisericia bacterium]|nr:Clp1/GlmU family protein [Caldisericia bacterium]
MINKIIVPSEWEELKEKFLSKGKKLIVLGGSDSGKSTFILYLANSIASTGKKVGILDLDIGQSNIGPPGTIGYGVLEKEIESLDSLQPKKMVFIGAVSPKGNLLQIVVGARKLLDSMEMENLDYILIDTTGLVDGLIAEVLKHNKIECLNPDFIVLFQKENERENLIKPFLYDGKEIVRLKINEIVRERSRIERIEYRNRKFSEYFKNSKRVEIFFKEHNILGYNINKFDPINNSIVGLLDKERFLLYLGILEKFNREKMSIIIDSPIGEEKGIKYIKFSNLIYNIKTFAPS